MCHGRRWRKSGWLNEIAACRELEAGGRGRYVCAEKAGVRRCRACVELTSNMPLMSVTLDVLKLSGWLKSFASCAESKWSHRKRGRHVG